MTHVVPDEILAGKGEVKSPSPCDEYLRQQLKVHFKLKVQNAKHRFWIVGLFV